MKRLYEIYFKDINKYKLLSDEEEVKLIYRAQNGDGVAFNKLITSNLKFVISVAKKYKNQGLGFMDLISAGNIGLIEAIKRFEPSRGYKLITYAVHWIKQKIRETINNESRLIRLPMNKAGNVSKIIKSLLEQEMGTQYQKKVEEICDEYKISEYELVELLHLYYMNSPKFRDYIIEDEYLLIDRNFLEEFLDSETRTILSNKLNKLKNRQQFIARKYFDLFGNSWTLEMIGEELDLTRERVRQIKEMVLEQLQSSVQKSDFNSSEVLPYSQENIFSNRFRSNFNIIYELSDYRNKEYDIIEDETSIKAEIEKDLQEDLLRDLYESL